MNTEKQQQYLSRQLAHILITENITKINLVSIGNSIASGYAMIRPTKPLLLRGSNIKSIMNSHNIDLHEYHFARAENNADSNILKWLLYNTSLHDIHQLNRRDFSKGVGTLPLVCLSQQEFDQYYPLNNCNFGLQDLIKDSLKQTATLFIYNGCTGSFVDSITRDNGKNIFNSFKRDLTSIDTFLNITRSINRQYNCNSQVYICGIPNILGLSLTEIINAKLRKMTFNYPQAVYVNPPVLGGIYTDYSTIDQKWYIQEMFEKFLSCQLDIHYSDDEYLHLLNHILKTCNNNYAFNKEFIDWDQKLYYYSKQAENNSEVKNCSIDTIGNKKMNLSKENLQKVKQYLTNNFTSDFYYIGKDNMEKVLTKIKQV